MIKYIKSSKIPHVQQLKKHQMKYWYVDSQDFAVISHKSEEIYLPQHLINCKITIRYISRYYPEALI